MKNNKWIWFAAGILSTVLVISVFNFFTSYRRNAESMLRTQIYYKGQYASGWLSADAYGYLTDGEFRPYFGELPSEDNAIRLAAPKRAVWYVYPCDEDSLLISYHPTKGIPRTYKKSGYGDFNRLLNAIYRQSGNEAFNVKVVY